MASNWDPAHSLVEDFVSGAEILAAPCLPAMAVTHLPICLQGGRALYSSQLALLWYLLNSLFSEHARDYCVVFEPFTSKVFVCLFVLFLCQSHSLGCYLAVAPSGCPQGIHAQSLS